MNLIITMVAKQIQLMTPDYTVTSYAHNYVDNIFIILFQNY